MADERRRPPGAAALVSGEQPPFADGDAWLRESRSTSSDVLAPGPHFGGQFRAPAIGVQLHAPASGGQDSLATTSSGVIADVSAWSPQSVLTHSSAASSPVVASTGPGMVAANQAMPAITFSKPGNASGIQKKACVRCGNKDNSETSYFCCNCGLQLALPPSTEPGARRDGPIARLKRELDSMQRPRARPEQIRTAAAEVNDFSTVQPSHSAPADDAQAYGNESVQAGHLHGHVGTGAPYEGQQPKALASPQARELPVSGVFEAPVGPNPGIQTAIEKNEILPLPLQFAAPADTAQHMQTAAMPVFAGSDHEHRAVSPAPHKIGHGLGEYAALVQPWPSMDLSKATHATQSDNTHAIGNVAETAPSGVFTWPQSADAHQPAVSAEPFLLHQNVVGSARIEDAQTENVYPNTNVHSYGDVSAHTEVYNNNQYAQQAPLAAHISTDQHKVAFAQPEIDRVEEQVDTPASPQIYQEAAAAPESTAADAPQASLHANNTETSQVHEIQSNGASDQQQPAGEWRFSDALQKWEWVVPSSDGATEWVLDSETNAWSSRAVSTQGADSQLYQPDVTSAETAHSAPHQPAAVYEHTQTIAAEQPVNPEPTHWTPHYTTLETHSNTQPEPINQVESSQNAIEPSVPFGTDTQFAASHFGDSGHLQANASMPAHYTVAAGQHDSGHHAQMDFFNGAHDSTFAAEASGPVTANLQQNGQYSFALPQVAASHAAPDLTFAPSTGASVSHHAQVPVHDYSQGLEHVSVAEVPQKQQAHEYAHSHDQSAAAAFEPVASFALPPKQSFETNLAMQQPAAHFQAQAQAPVPTETYGQVHQQPGAFVQPASAQPNVCRQDRVHAAFCIGLGGIAFALFPMRQMRCAAGSPVGGQPPSSASPTVVYRPGEMRKLDLSALVRPSVEHQLRAIGGGNPLVPADRWAKESSVASEAAAFASDTFSSDAETRVFWKLVCMSAAFRSICMSPQQISGIVCCDSVPDGPGKAVCAALPTTLLDLASPLVNLGGANNAAMDASAALADMLCKGQRADAASRAVEQRLWTHAMLLSTELRGGAAPVPVETLNIAVEFARNDLPAGHPLRIYYLLVAGAKIDAAELEQPILASIGDRHAGQNAVSAQHSSGLWPLIAAMLAMNRVQGGQSVLVRIGDALLSANRHHAAWTCFLLAQDVSLIGSPRMTPIGSHGLRAFEIIEMAALAAVPKGAPLPLFPALIAAKVQHAEFLADAGVVGTAVRYCESIEALLVGSRREGAEPEPGSVDMRVRVLANLLKKYAGGALASIASPATSPGGSASWLPKVGVPQLGGLLQVFDRGLTKVIGVDAEAGTPPQEAKQSLAPSEAPSPDMYGLGPRRFSVKAEEHTNAAPAMQQLPSGYAENTTTFHDHHAGPHGVQNYALSAQVAPHGTVEHSSADARWPSNAPQQGGSWQGGNSQAYAGHWPDTSAQTGGQALQNAALQQESSVPVDTAQHPSQIYAAPYAQTAHAHSDFAKPGLAPQTASQGYGSNVEHHQHGGQSAYAGQWQQSAASNGLQTHGHVPQFAHGGAYSENFSDLGHRSNAEEVTQSGATPQSHGFAHAPQQADYSAVNSHPAVPQGYGTPQGDFGMSHLAISDQGAAPSGPVAATASEAQPVITEAQPEKNESSTSLAKSDASSKSSVLGMLTGWFGGRGKPAVKDGEKPSEGAKKANLGKSSDFYFDKTLNRWVDPNDPETLKPAVPPPPPMASGAPAGVPGAPGPSSAAPGPISYRRSANQPLNARYGQAPGAPSGAAAQDGSLQVHPSAAMLAAMSAGSSIASNPSVSTAPVQTEARSSPSAPVHQGAQPGWQQPAQDAHQTAPGIYQPPYGAQQPAHGAQQPMYSAQQPAHGAQQPLYSAEQFSQSANQTLHGAPQPPHGAHQPVYSAYQPMPDTQPAYGAQNATAPYGHPGQMHHGYAAAPQGFSQQHPGATQAPFTAQN